MPHDKLLRRLRNHQVRFIKKVKSRIATNVTPSTVVTYPTPLPDM